MATLILSMDGLVLKEIPLDKARVSIGRKSGNDVQIENPAISGEHAAVTTVLNDSFLEDLGSTNGTLVNGRATKRCALHHNDVIEIGKYRLKYLNELASKEEERENVQLTKSQIADFIPAPTETLISALNSENPYSTVTPDSALLRILSGPKRGLELPLNRPELTLGKTGQQVARIVQSAHGYRIDHVEGKPIVINEKVYGQGSTHALRDLDQIEIQGVKMLFVIEKK